MSFRHIARGLFEYQYTSLIILAQYCSILKIPGYTCLPEYVALGNCRIVYTYISTYYPNGLNANIPETPGWAWSLA
jgi:hypothetical protein